MSEPISVQVRRALGRMDDRFLSGAGIIFSVDGHRKALREVHMNALPFDPIDTTYMGLPYRIDRDKDAPEVRVLDSDQIAGGVRLTVPFPVPSPSQSTQDLDVLLIGRALTRVQLSEVIKGFIDAHPNEQPMTDMLCDWLQTHGRFE